MQCRIFQEDLVGVELKNVNILLNRPVYTGMAILDQSKLIMMDFFHDFLKPKYGGNLKLLLSDTDSVICHIETDDFYEDVKHNALFDFSNYPANHGNFNICNKAVPGKFKDEMGGLQILEFVGLKSKQYSFTTEDKKEVKRCKGITRATTEKQLRH